MMKRTIGVDMDSASGSTTIEVMNSALHVLGRVLIQEMTDEGDWAVRGSDRAVTRFGSLETAFRRAIMAAVEQVEEDLLPTKSR